MKIKINPLDKLFSEFIRKRAVLTGGCECCGKDARWQDLQCSHFIGRRKQATRYDPDNACGLCFSCHLYLGEHPYEHTAFFTKRLGSEGLERLVIKGNTVTKLDKEAVKEYLKGLLAEINKEG